MARYRRSFPPRYARRMYRGGKLGCFTLSLLPIVIIILIMDSGCTSKTTNVIQQPQENRSTLAPISPTPSINKDNNPNKVNRDFAFLLINTRQQFKDIAKIGLDGQKSFLDKKINQDEFNQKIELMHTQQQKIYDDLKNNIKVDDSELISIYNELNLFLLKYYLDLFYNSLKASAENDMKKFQNLIDQSRVLEGDNKKIDKELADLKTKYNL